jgi:hypothetical protein
MTTANDRHKLAITVSGVLLALSALRIGVNWRPHLFAPANLLLFAAKLDDAITLAPV